MTKNLNIKNEKLKTLIKSNRTEFNILLVFLVFYIVMSFVSPVFNTSRNVLNVLSQSAVVALIAIGQTFVIVSGGIDLSAGSIVAFSGILGGMMMVNTESSLAGIIVILISATLIGCVNGYLVGFLRMPPFIVTLGTQAIALSLTYIVSNGGSFSGFPESFNLITSLRFLDIRFYIVVVVLMYLLFSWITRNTKLGRFTYAIGSNNEAARLSGINVKLYTMLPYILMGLLTGIATIVNTSRLMAVDPTTGAGLEMDAIAAVVVGGTSMAGGKGRLFGTFFGVLLTSFLRNALNLLGINPFWQGTATGAIIILAVLVEKLSNKE